MKPIPLQQKTSGCSYVWIVSLLCFLFLMPLAQAQQNQTNRPRQGQATRQGQNNQQKGKKGAPQKEAEEVVPFYNGTYIGLDLYGLGSKLLGGDFLSSEVNVRVNLKNKFIPTVELGYGKTSTWSDNGIHYKTGAPYFRFGVDYNTMAKKKNKNSYLYVGLRYAMTSFKYDVYNLPLTDPIFGGTLVNPGLIDGIWGGSVPYDYKGVKCSMQWFELVAGIHVKVYKNFYMGWALRMKYKMSGSFSKNGNPWYVPGYGEYKSNNIGVTYTVIYKLPY